MSIFVNVSVRRLLLARSFIMFVYVTPRTLQVLDDSCDRFTIYRTFSVDTLIYPSPTYASNSDVRAWYDAAETLLPTRCFITPGLTRHEQSYK
jgi:hypothetical protein